MKLKKLAMVGAIVLSMCMLASCSPKKSAKPSTPTSVPTVVPSTDVPTTPGTTNPVIEPGTTVPTTTPSTTVPSTIPSTTVPSTPSIPGYEENGTNTGSIENGTGEVLESGQVNVKGCSGLIEAGYVLYDNIEGANSYNIYVKGNKYADFTLVDDNVAYTRAVSSSQTRTDLFGLAKGNYQVKIVPVVAGSESNAKATIVELGVTSYDRSGYAHFNNTEGVGAYNDDGTLKDDAIVIYLTEENKNNVIENVDELKDYIFNVPNLGTRASGIGWWINNAQYTKQGSNTYDSTMQGGTLGFANVNENHPIVIRIVGEVTAPEGLTAYNSVNQGGTKGDNGNMARMKNLRNVTIEGVGTDAIIKGWGIHFICSDTTGLYGRNFEARNLTFDQYPEDALGMEGVQVDSTATLTAPVERCWVHNCTFLPGYCANPAESDKSEGDGSCDFKRGRYFTMSYCYFEDCHKTNLIGSGEDSLQYNITFHHNYWYNCGSRMPLARQANIHFYNNYVYGDINTAEELSYVSSIRANAYMYSENNYYEGCKQPFTTGEGGGNAKLFNNVFLSCFKCDFNSVGAYEVTSRTQSVPSNCKYQNISYSDFDTNTQLFYYNSETQTSDCYLTTATVARTECIKFSGSYYRTILGNTKCSPTKLDSNLYTPTNTVDLSSGAYNAVLPNNKNNQEIGGISYANISGISSGTIKFKGQGVTFTLNTYATVTMTVSCSSSDAKYPGSLVKSTGEVMLNGSGSAVLNPGTYYITSGIMDKETQLSLLSFEKYNSDEVKDIAIETYNTAYSKIPLNIEYTDACYLLIKDAVDAYNGLGEWKSEVSTTPYTQLEEYKSLGVLYVEGLIDSIGTVTIDSGNTIVTARNEYDKLVNTLDVEIDNYSTLVAAEKTFENYAVQSCINKIDSIGTVTLNSKDAILSARAEYDLLSNDQKANVTNYSILVSAEAELLKLSNIANINSLLTDLNINDKSAIKEFVEQYNKLTQEEVSNINDTTKLSSVFVAYTINLIDDIGTVTNTSGDAINTAEAMYNSLNDQEKEQVTNYSTLVAAKTAFLEIQSQLQEYNFTDGTTNEFFTISGGGTSTSKGTVTYNGVTYTNCFKVTSSASISITPTKTGTFTLVFSTSSAGNTVYVTIDGVQTSVAIPSDGILTVEVEEGQTCVITKNKSESFLFYLSFN